MTFEEARVFGDITRRVYRELRYALIDVPMAAPKARIEFVLDMAEMGATPF